MRAISSRPDMNSRATGSRSHKRRIRSGAASDIATEGSANAGTAATRAMQIPARTYGACPNLLMTNPWIGAGTGAPGGAGTSRVHEASRLFGRASTGICRNRGKTHANSARRRCIPSRNLVRSRSVLGQAQTPRRRLLPFAAIALVVLAAPALGLAGSSQSASSLRSQNAQLESRSRSAVLELYSLDQRLAGAQLAARPVSRRFGGLTAGGARRPHPRARDRSTRRSDRPAATRPPAYG